MDDGKGHRKSKGGVSLLNPHARQLAQPPRNGRKLREGWLLIAGYSRLRGVFVDKRYFVLWENLTLSFFAAPPYNERSAPIGELVLTKQSVVRPVKVRGQEWSFEIKLTQRAEKVMRVGATDEAERDRWMRAIVNCCSGVPRTPTLRKQRSAGGDASDTDSDNEESVSRLSEEPEYSVSGLMGSLYGESPVMKARDLDNSAWVDLELDDELTKEDRRDYVEGKNRSKVATFRAKDNSKRSSDEFSTNLTGRADSVGSNSPSRQGSISRNVGGILSALSPRANRGGSDGSGKGESKDSSTPGSTRAYRNSDERTKSDSKENALSPRANRSSNDKGLEFPKNDMKEPSSSSSSSSSSSTPPHLVRASTVPRSSVLTWEGVLGKSPPLPPVRSPPAPPQKPSSSSSSSNAAANGMSSNDNNSDNNNPLSGAEPMSNTPTTLAQADTATTPTAKTLTHASETANATKPPPLVRESSWGGLPPRSPLVSKSPSIVRPNLVTWEGVLGPAARSPTRPPPAAPRPPSSPSPFVTVKISSTASTTTTATTAATTTSSPAAPPPCPSTSEILSSPSTPKLNQTTTDTANTTSSVTPTESKPDPPKRKPAKPPHVHHFTMPSPSKLAQMHNDAALHPSATTTTTADAAFGQPDTLESGANPPSTAPIKPRKPINTHKNATLGAVRHAPLPLSELDELGVYVSPPNPASTTDDISSNSGNGGDGFSSNGSTGSDASGVPSSRVSARAAITQVRDRSRVLDDDDDERATQRSNSAHSRSSENIPRSSSGMNQSSSALSFLSAENAAASPLRSPSPAHQLMSIGGRRVVQRRSSSASPPRPRGSASKFRANSPPSHVRTQSEKANVPASLLQTSASFIGLTPTHKPKMKIPKFATLWGGKWSHSPNKVGAEDSVLEERDGVSLRDMLRSQHEDDDEGGNMTFREMLRSKNEGAERESFKARGSFKSERGSIKSDRESIGLFDESIFKSLSQDRDGNNLREQLQRARVGMPPVDGEEGEDAPWSRDDILRERSMTVRGVYQLGQWVGKKEEASAYFWDDGFDGYENEQERSARRPKRRAKQKRIGKDELDESVAPTLNQGALDKLNQAKLRRKAGAEVGKTCLHAGWVLKAGVGPLTGKSYKRRFLMLWSTNELTWTRVQPYNNKSALRGKLEAIFLESEVGATTSSVGFTWELRLADIRTYKFVAQTNADREAWLGVISSRGVRRFDKAVPTGGDDMRRHLRSSVSCASPPVVSYVHFDEHSFEDGAMLPSFTRDRRNQLETPTAYLLSEMDRAPGDEESDDKDTRTRNRLRPRSPLHKTPRPPPLSVSSDPLSPSKLPPSLPTLASSPTSPTLKPSPPTSPFSPILRPATPSSPPLKPYFSSSPPAKSVLSASSPPLRSSPPKSPFSSIPPLALSPDSSPATTAAIPAASSPPTPAVTPAATTIAPASDVTPLSPQGRRRPPKKPPRRKQLILAAEATEAQRLEAAVWVAEGAAAAATSASSIAATYEATAMHAVFSISFVIFQARD